ncbi:hypothetical protein [Paludibaculum fermentans]|uniref:Big-1 domain-containing protein n=1 Tax=Paludibaculum fermentans TaxID=1473598 RepID=A0A7S7NKF1_PALFE|nr:hypothetical protein [Paludibaculum fermentans]QOY85278.1 hypothetical protein IRI77_20820 [Paludibaculum fermentans]
MLKQNSILRIYLSLFLSALLCGQGTTAPTQLNIVIVEGDGVINNVRQRVAREPIVQVEDENHKPVAGAVVTFLLPGNGPGATFANGVNTLTAVTGPDGRATARGLQANNHKGQYQMRVTASAGGLAASAVIGMSNVAAAAALSSTAIWAIVLIAGAAAAAGIALGVNSGGGGSNQTGSPVTVTPGTPSVTPPR